MAENSKIEWTDHTFNPWIGCTKVSPGCDNCYAEHLMDKRMHTVQWGAGKERKRTSAANWSMPLKWNKQAAREGRRYRVFCASLADVFDNDVPAEWRADLFDLIRMTQNLDWLLLTKRIGNAHEMMLRSGGYTTYERPYSDHDLSDRWKIAEPLPNVWLGATIVNQEEADRDIQKLLRVPAAKRFLSIEPLLGPVNLYYWLGANVLHELDGGPRLDWIIVGGESGARARPMHPDWARSLRDQCIGSGVPFFFKQWGEWAPAQNIDHWTGTVDGAWWVDRRWILSREDLGRSDRYSDDEPDLYRIGKKSAGRLLDDRTWDELPT